MVRQSTQVFHAKLITWCYKFRTCLVTWCYSDIILQVVGHAREALPSIFTHTQSAIQTHAEAETTGACLAASTPLREKICVVTA